MILQVLDHLWQSTWFTLVIAVLAMLVRNNGAHIRYGMWLAASVKFLLPFSLLMYAGSQFSPFATDDVRFADLDRWADATLAPASARDRADPAVQNDTQDSSFAPTTSPNAGQSSDTPAKAGQFLVIGWLAGLFWLTGFLTVMALWFERWRRLRRLVAAGTPSQITVTRDLSIPVLESASSIEPGVVGIVQPVLLMPKGIASHLTSGQLQAVLVHELTHWRRRDNLTASLHMLVEAIFWFHPLTWLIGAQLIRERERACDETAVRLVDAPEVYAEGILGVCQYYVAPPRLSAAAISGGDLRRRIETIVANLTPEALNMTKKIVLSAFAVTVIAVPFLLGGIEPIAAQQTDDSTPPVAATVPIANSSIESLYGIALQEGSVNVMAFDPRDATWMVEAFGEAFPGIHVNIRTSLGHLPMIIGDAVSPQPSIDVVLTSLIEGNALYEEGYLAPTDFDSFGVKDSHIVLNDSFAYTNSIVYTVVYDSRRVGPNATIPPADPNNPNKIPATWRDLLDVSYAGKISTNPFVLPRAIAGLGTVWGISDAEDYARRLAEDQQLLASFGDTKMFFLDETRPQMYYLAQVNTLTEQWETQGLTTDYVVPEPIVIEQQGTGVMAMAPHPAAAALLAGWLASPEGLGIRKRVADSADLLPDSDDELALELRARNVEIVYDTPATTDARGELATIIQPYIRDGYNFYDRNPQPTPTIFQPAPSNSSPIVNALENLLREFRSRVE